MFPLRESEIASLNNFTERARSQRMIAIGTATKVMINHMYVSPLATFHSKELGELLEPSIESPSTTANQINQRFMRHLQSAPRYHVLTVMVEQNRAVITPRWNVR